MTNRSIYNVGHRTLVAKTCTVCGVLKDRSEYFVDRDGYLKSECRDCSGTYGRRYNHETQAKTRQEATKHGQPWTSRELEQLEALVSKGYIDREIAKILSRSLSSITNQKKRQGLTNPNRRTS